MATRRGNLRPGGRTEKVRKAVAAVVLELIKSGNLNFSLQDISKLSGVHRTTIYARWPDRASLFAEAVAEHSSKFQITLTGDWREDLTKIAFAYRDFCTDPVEIVMNSLLASSSDGEFTIESIRYMDTLLERLAAPFRDAQKQGVMRADVDPVVIIEMLVSSIVARVALAKQYPGDEVLESIVQVLVLACSQEITLPRRTPEILVTRAAVRDTRLK